MKWFGSIGCSLPAARSPTSMANSPVASCPRIGTSWATSGADVGLTFGVRASAVTQGGNVDLLSDVKPRDPEAVEATFLVDEDILDRRRDRHSGDHARFGLVVKTAREDVVLVVVADDDLLDEVVELLRVVLVEPKVANLDPNADLGLVDQRRVNRGLFECGIGTGCRVVRRERVTESPRRALDSEGRRRWNTRQRHERTGGRRGQHEAASIERRECDF